MGGVKLEGFDKRMALEVIEDTLEALHGPEDPGAGGGAVRGVLYVRAVEPRGVGGAAGAHSAWRWGAARRGLGRRAVRRRRRC